MEECCVNASQLVLDDGEILRLMGYGSNKPDDVTAKLLIEVQADILTKIKPKYSYVIVDKIDFKCGSVIANALANAERYAIIVSTLGEESDNYLHEIGKNDILRAFIADAVASESVEAVQRLALDSIEYSLDGTENLSNPYSPGYCGWQIKEQQKLFAYFPQSPCGVTLNSSYLMTPIKSISSVVAIGANVVKAPYGCQICKKIDCYKKR